MPLVRAERVFGQSASPVAVPINLELVTVTDTQAVITWYTADPTKLDGYGRPAPAPTPGRVLIGTTPNLLDWEPIGEHEATAYHYVEIDGLQPGTTYYWRAESNGIPAVPTALTLQQAALIPAPPSFTTLVPPPGRELARVAWLNDMPIGEHVSGLAYSNSDLPGGGFPPGFPVDPEDPYWRFMGETSVAEAASRGCRSMFVNGDLTGAAEPVHVVVARQLLDAFGRLGGSRDVTPDTDPTYFVTRGNHDRAHSGPEFAACSEVPGRPDLRDCFLDHFRESFDDGSTRFSVTVGDERARFRFVGLDTNEADVTGVMPQHELDYLEAELDKDESTVVLCHHLVGDVAQLISVIPGASGVEFNQAARFREVVARHDNVALVYNGHTHRNFRSYSTDTGGVPYFEGAATKEYPAGYTVVRLFEGGFMVNFWKASQPKARAWSELSRGEYLGLYPYYTLGSLGDRNWVHRFDASQVTSGAEVPGSEERVTLPDTGPSEGSGPGVLGPAAIGTAAAAAGVALVHRSNARSGA